MGLQQTPSCDVHNLDYTFSF